MKKVFLLSAVALLAIAGSAFAQNIITENGTDSAQKAYTSGADLTVVNGIRSGTSTDVVLKWSIVSASTTFGPGWEIVGSGVCDNNICWNAQNASNNLFNNDTLIESNPYDNSPFPTGGSFGSLHDFHVVFAANNPPNGSAAIVRVNAMDKNSLTTRTLTFIAYKGTLGVNTFKSSDDIVLFPNPAHEAVNVVYDPSLGVKTIAVYNLIGKLVGPLYRPTSTGSAHIDLGEVPTGVYFLRLMDGQGRVVATRRFTRQ
ncbi:MAG: T9SS type A sorting domain-containing protein [Bacteroidetes bacterium]|nr:T9SS type A sorting domain-containing protein [Bacteroidota bacterium]